VSTKRGSPDGATLGEKVAKFDFLQTLKPRSSLKHSISLPDFFSAYNRQQYLSIRRGFYVQLV